MPTFKAGDVSGMVEYLRISCEQGRSEDSVTLTLALTCLPWRRGLLRDFQAIARSPFDLEVSQTYAAGGWRRLYNIKVTGPAEYVLEWLKIVATKVD